MNKHFISYLVILGLFAMSLAGCGRSNTAADQAVNPTPAQEAPADAPNSEADTSTESSAITSNSMKIFLDS